VLALVLAACLGARGDAYRVLHVRALTISVDRTHVPLGQALHLTVRAVVGERVQALPELILPDLTAFQVLADSERLDRQADATTYVAVLTITPNLPGPAVIGPAYIDAIDPRSRQPLRYRSNTVTVVALAAAPGEAGGILTRLKALALGGLALVGLATAALALGALALARRRRPAAAADHALEPFAPALPPGEALAAWVARLRHAPSRANAVGARAALWERLGAGERETAEDVAARTSDARWRRAVAAAERAAFVEPGGEAASALHLADALEVVCR